jgi:acetyl-CoA carboxylase biotin carboxyl carrier protein
MNNRPSDTDVEFIRALAELLRANDLTEIDVRRDFGESDALNVRLTRQINGPAMVGGLPALHPNVSAAQAPQVASAAPVPVPVDPAEDPGVVSSPMVGTVYLQAEPGTAPFVKVGDTVTEGQTILIIEAMKTMNQIPAPRAGRIKRILVEDGSPVEFGAPLLILE